MMQTNASRRRQSIAANTSNAAGNTTTGTAVAVTDLDLLTLDMVAKLTNGATGPTVAPKATLQVQIAGSSTWYDIETKFGDTTNSSVNVLRFRVPACRNARVVVTGNTGQAVTCEAFLYGLSRAG